MRNNHRILNSYFATCCLAALIGLGSCTEKAAEMFDPLVNTAAPDFTLQSDSGQTVSLSGFSGKVTVLFFFGNNCPSCKAASPSIESMLYGMFKSYTDFAMAGLDQWNGNQALVTSFRTSTGVTFPLLMNAASVATTYKTTYDRFVVIDKDGQIIFSGKQSAANDLNAVISLVTSKVTPITNNENKAPDFSLTSITGATVKLSDYAGKVKVLFFLGFNCPYCIAAGPEIESKLHSAFSEYTDYVILGLDQWNGNQASLEAFKTSSGVTFPLLLSASATATDYKTTYDRFVVVDKAGDIIFKGTQTAANDINTVVDLVKTKVTPPTSTKVKAPDFTLSSLTNSQVKLSDNAGKVVVLFFLGYACPSCLAAGPDIQGIYNQFASNANFRMYGLDVWNGSQSQLEGFKNSTSVSFPLLLNASATSNAYKTTYDRLIVVDKSGNIALQNNISASGNVGNVKLLVDQLLQ